VNLKSSTVNPTKRSILSTITSSFYPLGLLGPVFKCKIFLQKLWQRNNRLEHSCSK
jgi:hypothetical protein